MDEVKFDKRNQGHTVDGVWAFGVFSTNLPTFVAT